jgi:hypothetical protein
VEQDGVLLLMPREPSLAFYYVPLCLVAVGVGVIVGVLS